MNNIKTNMLFFVLAALIFAAYGSISFITPSDLIQWLSQHYHLDSERMISLSLYVNESAWFKMKVVLVLAFLFLVYLFVYDKYIIRESFHAMAALCRLMKKEWLRLSIIERRSVFILLGLFSVFLTVYCSYTPIQLDELHTWLYYIDRGALVTASYYPASNNHIGYNLLSVFWNLFLPPLWAVRIVSILSAIGSVALFFIVLRHRYSVAWSVAGMLWLMTSAPFVWYGVQGRGYELELLGLLLILFLLVQSHYDVATDRLLVLMNVFTLYVIPIAAIPLALLNLAYAYRLIRNGGKNIYRIIRTAIYSMVLSFFFYAPVGIFSGFDSLVNNPFVQHISYKETLSVGVIDYMPRIWIFISGCSGIFSCVTFFAVGLATVLYLLLKNRFALLPVAVLMTPFVLLQVYPVLLFERTWLWLIIPFLCWLIEIMYWSYSTKRIWISLPFLCLMLLIMLANLARLHTTNKVLRKDSERFMEMKQVIEHHAKGKILVVQDDVVYEYLVYDQLRTKKYTLLYSNTPDEVKGDVILKSNQSFDATEGEVLWSNAEVVLYLPK